MSAQVSLISSRENQNMFLGSVQETSVEQCEAFLDHLPCELGDALELCFGAQLQGDQVLGAAANAMCDIVASDHQVLAAVIATAEWSATMVGLTYKVPLRSSRTVTFKAVSAKLIDDVGRSSVVHSRSLF